VGLLTPPLLFFLSGYFALHFFDVGYDSQTNYEPIMVQLGKLWNPILDGPLDIFYQTVYINSYPKAMFWLGSALFHFFGSINAGKAPQLLFGLATFSLTAGTLLRLGLASKRWALALALFVTWNPVSLTQWATAYVDSALYFNLTISCLLLILFITERKAIWLLLYGLCVIFTVNIKFTGPLYLGVFGVMAGLWQIVRVATRRYKKSDVVHFTLVGFGSVVFGMIVIGYHPYVTNFNQYHNILPVYSSFVFPNKKPDFPWRDPTFDEGSAATNFYVSYFSCSQNTGAERRKTLVTCKDFFSVMPQEMNAFTAPDNKIGGLGPYYGFLMWTALLALLVLIKTDRSNIKTSLFVLLTVWLSVASCPEIWWARFVPQAWLLPMVVLMSLVGSRKQFRGRAVLLGLMSTIIVMNTAFVLVPNAYHQIVMTRAIANQYSVFRDASQQVPIQLYHSDFSNIRRRFKETSIRYLTDSRLKLSEPLQKRHRICTDPIPILGSPGSEVCLAENMPNRTEWQNKLMVLSLPPKEFTETKAGRLLRFFSFRWAKREPRRLGELGGVCTPLFGSRFNLSLDD